MNDNDMIIESGVHEVRYVRINRSELCFEILADALFMGNVKKDA